MFAADRILANFIATTCRFDLSAVPQSIVYDNDRCLEAKILPDSTRNRATLFSGFLSHYLVRDHYGCPSKGNYTGSVEGLVGYGPSGAGKSHIAISLRLAACQKELSVGFTTAAALVSEMMDARDEDRLLRFQKQMAGCKLLIVDELGFVPLSKTGAELLFKLISRR